MPLMLRPAPADPDHVDAARQYVRVGCVVAVDRASGLCIVEIGDPEGEPVETAEIQWAALRAGETIVWSPPSEGEQVMLLCPDGDIAQAIALPALFSQAFPAPGNGSREFVRFADGAEIGYDPDGSQYDITLPAGATASIVADGGVTIDASEGGLTILGDVTVQGDVVADGVSLKQHVHSGVMPGGGQTGIPVQ